MERFQQPPAAFGMGEAGDFASLYRVLHALNIFHAARHYTADMATVPAEEWTIITRLRRILYPKRVNRPAWEEEEDA